MTTEAPHLAATPGQIHMSWDVLLGRQDLDDGHSAEAELAVATAAEATRKASFLLGSPGAVSAFATIYRDPVLVVAPVMEDPSALCTMLVLPEPICARGVSQLLRPLLDDETPLTGRAAGSSGPLPAVDQIVSGWQSDHFGLSGWIGEIGTSQRLDWFATRRVGENVVITASATDPDLPFATVSLPTFWADIIRRVFVP
jgi:hypothetical protein